MARGNLQDSSGPLVAQEGGELCLPDDKWTWSQARSVEPRQPLGGVLQYVWFVQDRLSHRLYWLHDWDCGLVVWVCTADHLEDEEASGGGQRHDTTTWSAFCVVAQWCGGNIQ